ncbi:hypothetical protein ACIQOV_03150, partial [Kitasatospora sp. NPDC091257]
MTTNTITGSRVAGPVVQAHSIHGGIHLHQSPENPWVRPDQLPRPAPVFVDRGAEYRTVADTLDRGGIPVLVGAHGVGKAALAARVLRAREQPGGYLVADLQAVLWQRPPRRRPRPCRHVGLHHRRADRPGVGPGG